MGNKRVVERDERDRNRLKSYEKYLITNSHKAVRIFYMVWMFSTRFNKLF